MLLIHWDFQKGGGVLYDFIELSQVAAVTSIQQDQIFKHFTFNMEMEIIVYLFVVLWRRKGRAIYDSVILFVSHIYTFQLLLSI